MNIFLNEYKDQIFSNFFNKCNVASSNSFYIGSKIRTKRAQYIYF